MKVKVIMDNEEYEMDLSEELIQKLKETKRKRWRAELKREYFYLEEFVSKWIVRSATELNSPIDDCRYKSGNYFKTVGEADFRIRHLFAIQEYEDFLANDLVTDEDWKNPNIFKYKAYFDFDPLRGLGIRTSADCLMKYQGAIYSKSKEKIEKFIKEFGEDNFKKYILGVKE